MQAVLSEVLVENIKKVSRPAKGEQCGDPTRSNVPHAGSFVAEKTPKRRSVEIVAMCIHDSPLQPSSLSIFYPNNSQVSIHHHRDPNLCHPS